MVREKNSFRSGKSRRILFFCRGKLTFWRKVRENCTSEAAIRSDILYLFGQGNLIFIREKLGNSEKCGLWQPYLEGSKNRVHVFLWNQDIFISHWIESIGVFESQWKFNENSHNKFVDNTICLFHDLIHTCSFLFYIYFYAPQKPTCILW